jgi:erythromycin esterase
MRVSRRRSVCLVIVLLALPIGVHSQSVPTEAFRQWARDHVHPIVSVNKEAHDDADLQALHNIVGDAHVVAFGEPVHGAHEPLAMRNRLIRYGVTRLGLTAVTLETCLSPSKRLYDYVLGRTAETDSSLKEAFCYGFGDLTENLELIRWLRNYNTTQPPARQVRFYGVDLTGQYFPFAYRSVEAVLTFLDCAAPSLGREVRRQYTDLIPVFRSDKYAKLTQAEKDAITGKVQDLIALIRRERTPLTAATSQDDYEWALRQAVSAAQDDAFLRSLPPEWDDDLLVKSPEKFEANASWNHKAEMRELALADNLLWVEQRECRRGKILFFAHDEHVQTSAGIVGSPTRPAGGPLIRIRVADTYLRSALGSDLVVIGTYFGRGTGFPHSDAPPPADAHRMEDLLGSLSIPQFIMNLHDVPSSGPLHEWFQMAYATRDSVSGQDVYMVAPLRAYDAILYIETITPSPAAQKHQRMPPTGAAPGFRSGIRA